MPRITYPSDSPYATTQQSNTFIGRYRHRRIAPKSDDVEYTIPKQYEHRPDLLAYELYGTPSLWWIFSSRNIGVIRHSIWDFTEGTVIFIPSNNQLRTIISS